MSAGRWAAAAMVAAKRRPLKPLAAKLVLGACLLAGTLLSVGNPVVLLAVASYGAMGYLLVVRRSRNVIGWSLISVALGSSIVAPSIGTWSAEILEGTAPSWIPMFFLLQRLCSAAGIMFAIAFLATVFPTGGWIRGGVGRLSAVGLALIGLLALLQALAPTLRLEGGASSGDTILVANPIGIAAGWRGWELLDPGGGAYLLGVGGFALCVFGFAIRFRRSVGTERLQGKWLVGALAFLATATAWGSVLVLVAGEGAASRMDATTYALASIVAWGPATIALPMAPIAIGIAVTRYHLYEIDRIISRTISYGLITATLVIVYAAVILLLQAPLGAVTGGQTVTVAASTLVAAALFQPLRRRVQAAVDQRFNRARYDAERTAAAFAAVLRDEVDPSHAQSALLTAVDSAIGPRGAAVWIRGESR